MYAHFSFLVCLNAPTTKCLPLTQSFSVRCRLGCRYKMASYRKHTKNHWARDDPAFAVILVSRHSSHI
jgi:hypothetical protein